MYYVIEVKGWPVLVWLQDPPPDGRYHVLARFDDVLMAVAGFYDAVQHARAATNVRTTGPRTAPVSPLDRPRYGPEPAKTMSPVPPAAKNRPTYDSPT